ncbi:type VII secretion integral membrane protein EccD [Streptomyces fumanus]|uniref:Type VII secretion integral membrane protein EccD n=1 Tax=Streptomyces fumanus TaxID=67302 RepID=A0A919E6D3_9ACTN|nr:type VII secretion integral membrane protein EccD [Streptomyces fumanus]GHF23827.1 type VII secretion integral membrane protein EccD [Streptomyces fumanus]
MSEASVAGLCRVTIRAPEKVLDLAVPEDIPLADLLPVIVSQAEEQAEEAPERGDWVLQRIGAEPFDPESTPASLGLRDGEVLLLRPESGALPPVRFDNLVDAVSSTVRGLPHGWSPAVSRWTLRAMTGAVLAVCLAVLALPGDTVSRASLAAGAALLALAGAGAASRALDDRPGGVLLGLAAAAFLGLAGVLVVGDPWAAGRGPVQGGAELLAGCAAAGTGAALALSVVSAYGAVFAAVGVVCAAGAVGGLLMLGLDVPFSAAAGGVAVVVVVFGAFVPRLAFFLSGLRLPPLPTTPEQLQEGIEPHTGEEVAAQAAATDRWMSGLYGGAGAVCALCLAGLARRPETPQLVTGGLLALLLFLHGRELGTSWQRLALFVPALGGPLAAAAVLAGHGGGRARLLTAAVLLAVAVLLALICWNVPGRRVLPHWGRAGDLLQSAVAFALVPVVLWSLGVYQMLRSANG